MHTSFAIRALSASDQGGASPCLQNPIAEEYREFCMVAGGVEPDRSNQFCAVFDTTSNECLQYQDMPTFQSDHDNSPTPCGWSYSENGGYVPCGEGYTCQSDPNIPDAAWCVEDDEGWPDPRPDPDYDDDETKGCTPIYGSTNPYADNMNEIISYDCGEGADPEYDPNGRPDDDYYLDPCVRDGDCGDDYGAAIKVYDEPEEPPQAAAECADGSIQLLGWGDPCLTRGGRVDWIRVDPRKGTYYDALDAAKRDSDGYLLTTQPVLYNEPMVKDAPLKDFYDTGTTGEDNFVPLLGEQPQTDKNGVAIIDPCAGTRCIALYKPCPEGYIDGNKCCPNTGNCIPDPNYVGTIKPALPIGQTPSTALVTPIAIATPTRGGTTPVASCGNTGGGFTEGYIPCPSELTPWPDEPTEKVQIDYSREPLSPINFDIKKPTALIAEPTTAPVAAVKKDSPLAIAALLFLAFEVLG